MVEGSVSNGKLSRSSAPALHLLPVTQQCSTNTMLGACSCTVWHPVLQILTVHLVTILCYAAINNRREESKIIKRHPCKSPLHSNTKSHNGPCSLCTQLPGWVFSSPAGMSPIKSGCKFKSEKLQFGCINKMYKDDRHTEERLLS